MEADADRQMLADALETLTGRERQIITLRFGLGGRREHTQKEVADQHGHLSVLHLPPGKAHHPPPAPGDLTGEPGAVSGTLFDEFGKLYYGSGRRCVVSYWYRPL